MILPTLDYAAVNSNPNMGSDPKHPMHHWKVLLEYQGRTMDTFYSMGSGHKGRPPEVQEVLECLFLDVDAGEMHFEEFCSESGYDEDSRKALAIHDACVKQAIRLRELLGADFHAIREQILDQ